DVVVILDALAPWWPDRHPLSPAARVINIGPDPIFSRFPVRNFRSDLSIAGETALTLPALIAAMEGCTRYEDRLRARRRRVAATAEATRRRVREAAAARNVQGIAKEWVSLCLGEALRGVRSSVFSELGSVLGVLERTEHRSWFQEPHS